MKLALVVPGGVDRGGEYRVIPALLALLRQLSQDHEVHVFARHQEPLPGTWQLAGATVHNIGIDPWLWRGVAAIRREHRRGRFDVVHAIWSAGCGVIAVVAARWLRLPSMVHVAGGELVGLRDIGYGGQLRWRGRLAERAVLRAVDVVSAASAPMITSIARLGVRAETVPLGVDLDNWAPRAPQRRSPVEPLRLIQIASLNRVKDQATLLRAMAKLRELELPVVLDIVGEDTLHGEMQQLAARLGVDSVTRFHGYLPQRQVREFVLAAHVCIVSSRHEAGPLALLEAAVVGVPAIGTSVGHLVEWAPRAAMTVGVGDHLAMAAAIAEIERDEDRRMELARHAHERSLGMSAWRSAAQFSELYERIARRR